MNNFAPKTPWLSVVIPAYHGERWIATALNSLAIQAVEGLEVLIVDGGPTTATVEIARSYCDRLRMRIFERRDLSSWHTKTNFAVSVAEAAHISWLGVDDVWLPGRTKAVREWIDAAPTVPLHLAASLIIGPKGQPLGRWRCPLPPDEMLSSSFVCKRLLVQNFVAAPAPVFRRDAYLRCGGLDEKLWYAADWDLWLKLAYQGPILYHDATTIGFRVHSNALTVTGSRDAAEFERQLQFVLERHVGRTAADSAAIARTARASMAVNLALAAAASGDWRGLPRAAWGVLQLGPAGIRRYFRDSRILERTLPRLRAGISGIGIVLITIGISCVMLGPVR